MNKLSIASDRILGQPMFQVLSRIKEMERQGTDIVHFEIGDPDFPSPPEVIKAGACAMNEGYTHYADSMGDYELRSCICEYNKSIRGFKPDIDQVVITPGANPIIYFAAACVANPGDEIIIPDPCFSTYISVLKYLNINIVPVPLRECNEFRMNPEDVKKVVTDKTRMIIINSPNNPTGAVMTKEELDEITAFCGERGIFVYLDEIYRELIYTEEKMYSPSISDKCKEFTIVADGFSKAYAMTGWRLGYAIAPIQLARKMGLLLETIVSCVPPFVQKAGIEALKSSEAYVNMMVEEYRTRRDALVNGLNRVNGIRCICPKGAFYAFANITETGLSSREFANLALEKSHVGIVAGDDFGDSGIGFVRFCYALSVERIQEGISRLNCITG